MKCDRKDLVLYAVTDQSESGGESLSSRVEKALRGGATFLQLRDKKQSGESLRGEALKLKEMCRQYHVPFVINDYVDLALAVDADGVHVGQEDMEAGQVRKLLGEEKIIGVSVQSVEQAVLAEKQGADYLGVGAVFPTGSKEDAVDVDRETLREICGAVSIPVIAIGGITKENVSELRGTGICGIAVISAIFAQPDIEAAARELVAIVRNTI